MKNKKTSINEIQNNNKKGYGLLSLMAMVIGIVIGSGIFTKNASLIGSAGSSMMVLASWVLGAVMIIALSIAFLEVISVTEITGEQSTVANWGRRLVGVRFGKLIGIYFGLIYFPVIMAGLFRVSADFFLHSLSYSVTPDHSDEWYNTISNNNGVYFTSLVAITFMFIIIIMFINAISNKPGKWFQNIGALIQNIPLLMIIGLFFAMIGSGEIHFPTNDELITEDVVSPGTLDSTANMFKALMLTMPGILFSFDGFLIAGSLSKEAKKESTFRIAFVFSMAIIIVIYLLFSMAILGLGNFEDDKHGAYGSISNAIYNTFDPDVAAVVDPITIGIITIAVLTGASGCSIGTYRIFADLSVNNYIKDSKGEILKKNKAGVNTNGAIMIIGITMIWFVIGIVIDSFAYSSADGWNGMADSVGTFGLDMAVVWAYLIYATIIFFAVINRFTKKTLVNKRLLFLPSAIVSIVIVTTITIVFAYLIFSPPGADASKLEKVVFASKMVYTSLALIMTGVLYFIFGLWTKKATAISEVTPKLQDQANRGNTSAIEAIAFIKNKNELVAEYFGVTAFEFEKEKEDVNRRIEEEKLTRLELKQQKHSLRHKEKITEDKIDKVKNK